MNEPVDYDLTCWYLNRRQVFELVGLERFVVADGVTSNQMVRLAEHVALKDALVNWLNRVRLPTLGQLIIREELRENTLFTHFSNFFGKGILNIHRALEKGKTDILVANLYTKLDDLKPEYRLSLRFHHEHLTAHSAWHELSGQNRLFTLGLVTKIADTAIEAIPYVIANPLPQFGRVPTRIGLRWATRLEVFVDGIDSFGMVRKSSFERSKSVLNALRGIPERRIKQAFAEIIGEPNVPKDWGGERSDLFSDRMQLDGERISTAFMFKGPAQFAPLIPAGLGKNGDQIDRLFSEPADLLVLQHCHEITPAVCGQMRAYAQQIGKSRLFCLIDGFDTLRLLRAYKKCGL